MENNANHRVATEVQASVTQKVGLALIIGVIAGGAIGLVAGAGLIRDKPKKDPTTPATISSPLTINEIQAVSLNEVVVSPDPPFHMIFYHSGSQLADLNTRDNFYILPPGAPLNPGNDPLRLEMPNLQNSPFTFPSRTITVIDENATTYTLCFPEVAIGQYDETLNYYYDVNGTPYTDVLLTQVVTCGEQDGPAGTPQGKPKDKLEME